MSKCRGTVTYDSRHYRRPCLRPARWRCGRDQIPLCGLHARRYGADRVPIDPPPRRDGIAHPLTPVGEIGGIPLLVADNLPVDVVLFVDMRNLRPGKK